MTDIEEKQVELNTLVRLQEEYYRRNLAGDTVTYGDIIQEHIEQIQGVKYD